MCRKSNEGNIVIIFKKKGKCSDVNRQYETKHVKYHLIVLKFRIQLWMFFVVANSDNSNHV